MQLTELLIIYLACGSPFGVFKISQCGTPRTMGDAAVIFLHFVIWPVFAAASFRNWLLSNSDSAETDLDTEVRDIRDKIERIAYIDRSPSAIFEFREVFSRYTGLTIALNFSENTRSPHPLFEVDERQDIRVASACIDRRDRQRLSFHQVQARNDLVDIISLLAISYPSDSELIRLGLKLADLLHDPETVNDLKMYLPESSPSDSGSHRYEPSSEDLKLTASSRS